MECSAFFLLLLLCSKRLECPVVCSMRKECEFDTLAQLQPTTVPRCTCVMCKHNKYKTKQFQTSSEHEHMKHIRVPMLSAHLLCALYYNSILVLCVPFKVRIYNINISCCAALYMAVYACVRLFCCVYLHVAILYYMMSRQRRLSSACRSPVDRLQRQNFTVNPPPNLDVYD